MNLALVLGGVIALQLFLLVLAVRQAARYKKERDDWKKASEDAIRRHEIEDETAGLSKSELSDMLLRQ